MTADSVATVVPLMKRPIGLFHPAATSRFDLVGTLRHAVMVLFQHMETVNIAGDVQAPVIPEQQPLMQLRRKPLIIAQGDRS
jgi:hypothetical protein